MPVPVRATRPLEAPVTGILIYDSASTMFGTGVASTGAKAGMGLGRAYSNFTLQGARSTGGSTRGTVQLQGRIAPSGSGESGLSSTAAWHNIGAAFVINAASVLANSTNSIRVTEIRPVVTSFSTLASTSAIDRPARLRLWVTYA